MASVRRSVWVLAVLSAALPAAFLATLLLRFVVSGVAIPSAVVNALVAGWVATAIARGVVDQRLNSAEQVVVRFWGLTPLVTLVMATALGAAPLLLLNLLASSLGWSPESTQVATRAVILVVAACALLAVWSFWVRARTSLPLAGTRGTGAA